MSVTVDPRIIPFISFAQRSHAKFWPLGPFVSCTLAQGIIESDYFRVMSGKNNFFGIKATGAQIAAGRYTRRWTHETINGVYKTMPQDFADYDDAEQCFDAHAHLLVQSWYADCIAAKTPQEYARALWRDHYGTGIPGHPYDAVIISVMDQFNLYQFDCGAPSITPKPPATAMPAAHD
jgi:flagellum-specific peptidoglycan hydrolase FlgJ